MINRCRVLFLVACFFSLQACAQKFKSVKATETVLVSEDLSIGEIKYKVIESAKLKALADAFGTIVVQGTDVNAKTSNGASDIAINNLSNALVKGEWVKTTEENCKWILDEKSGGKQQLFLQCEVQGKAREIAHTETSFEAKTLKCRNPAICDETDFVNNQNMYLSFKAPKSGYLSVFMREDDKVYRLLPYPTMKGDYDDAVPVEGDKEYVLFSYEHKDYFPGYSRATMEYGLYTNKERMFNRIYVLYSPMKYSKPILETGEGGIKTISPESFAAWLNRIKVSNPSIQEKVIFLTVRKKR